MESAGEMTSVVFSPSTAPPSDTVVTFLPLTHISTGVGEKGVSPLGSRSVTGVMAAVREGRASEVILAYAERRSPTEATFLSVAREVMLAMRANL